MCFCSFHVCLAPMRKWCIFAESLVHLMYMDLQYVRILRYAHCNIVATLSTLSWVLNQTTWVLRAPYWHLCIVAAMLQKRIHIHCQILFPSSFQKAYTLNVFWNCFHNFLYFPSIRCQQWWNSAPWWWPKPPSYAQSPVPQANAAVSNTCRWTTQVKSTPRALVPTSSRPRMSVTGDTCVCPIMSYDGCTSIGTHSRSGQYFISAASPH